MGLFEAVGEFPKDEPGNASHQEGGMMLRHMHPEASGPIEDRWRRYTRKPGSIDLLLKDMREAYGGGDEWFIELMYRPLRRAVREREYPAFGTLMSFSKRLCAPGPAD